ncbi:MAG: TVP38/TMEM64 family protein [Candidatus Omnitrophica bacterium]|nr:TVP38/TMEM64 family protein [Candidatus Omnitrophota bacterium]
MDTKILKNLVKVLIGVLLVAGIWWIVKCQCLNLESLTPSSIRDYIQGFGTLAAVIYIIAYALNTISIIPPIALLSLTAGLAFGKVWGAVYLMTGAMLGTTSTFFISRFFGRSLVDRILKGKGKKLNELLERKGFVTVLLFRLIPIVPYEVLNYACGLSKIKLKDYFLATFLGIIPGVVISAFFGGTLGEVKNLKDLLSTEFLVALGLLILIIAIPLIYTRVKKRNKK